MAKKKEKQNTDFLQEASEKLLEQMGTNATVSIEEDKDNEAIMVKISSENEAGLLIGNRGRTIEALQTILGLIYRRKTDEWKRVLVNIADWREKEESRLQELAEQAASRAIETGEPQQLYNLTPAQRRVVHLTLSEKEEVVTESKGEGRDRYLEVSPKS